MIDEKRLEEAFEITMEDHDADDHIELIMEDEEEVENETCLQKHCRREFRSSCWDFFIKCTCYPLIFILLLVYVACAVTISVPYYLAILGLITVGVIVIGAPLYCARERIYIYFTEERKLTKPHKKSLKKILAWLFYHILAVDQLQYIKSRLQTSFEKAVQLTGERLGFIDLKLSFGGSFPERLSIPKIPAALEFVDKRHAILSDIDMMLIPGYELASFIRDKERFFVKASHTPGFVLIYDNKNGERVNAMDIKKKLGNSVEEFRNVLFPSDRKYNSEVVGKARYQGPAIKAKVGMKENSFGVVKVLFNLDLTFSLKCREWPSSLSDWSTRPNKKWPQLEDIERIKAEGIHIVPKSRENDLKEVTWRLSFTNAEIMLMEMVPDVARKCLIGLKVITKDYLKPVCKELKSYHLKCIFLYKLEKEGVDFFNEETIEECFQSLLEDLENCIKNQSCPNFWISKINLFEEITKKRSLLNLLRRIRKKPSLYIEPFLRELPNETDNDDNVRVKFVYDNSLKEVLYDPFNRRNKNIPQTSYGEILMEKYASFEDTV